VEFGSIGLISRKDRCFFYGV